jgi:hypothetical protein
MSCPRQDSGCGQHTKTMINQYSPYLSTPSFSAKLISRAKRDGLGSHYAILLADQSVIEFDPAGVNVTNLCAFANGSTIYEHAVAPREALSGILHRTHTALKRDMPYHLLDNNCEHFARWLIGLPRESKQVSLVVMLSLITAVVYAVA